MPETTVQVPCPICNDENHTACKRFPIIEDAKSYECDACGKFTIYGTANIVYFQTDSPLSKIQRKLLSHYTRNSSLNNNDVKLSSFFLGEFLSTAKILSPIAQANNLILLIGEYYEKEGLGYIFDDALDTITIGCIDEVNLVSLRNELILEKIIKKDEKRPAPILRQNREALCQPYSLTLEGWKRFEAEKKGLFAGNYGFIAMKFADTTLDRFIAEVVKPGIKSHLDYNVVNFRDVERAGVIDNIMRQQIRDAAFVLVDLTHDNSGAYWEAGYAEGLGKPVIYLCEKNKFEDAKTHFDTNHCTTVLWSKDNPDEFTNQLVATLRRSLNLFQKIRGQDEG